MIKTLDSFATLLGMLTNTFLLEEPSHQLSQDKIHKAVENHQASFTSLKNNLAEAKSEWFSGLRGRGAEGRRQAYGDAVDSLTRLAQHLNGLRSGTRLQYELTKAHCEGRLTLKRRRQTIGKHVPGGYSSQAGKENGLDDADEILLQAAADMFGDAVDDLGPPLKALSVIRFSVFAAESTHRSLQRTCAASLKRLREAFSQSQHVQRKSPFEPHHFHVLMDEIERALFAFESTSNHAVMRLYRRSYFSAQSLGSSVDSLPQENVIPTNSENEHIFLLYL